MEDFRSFVCEFRKTAGKPFRFGEWTVYNAFDLPITESTVLIVEAKSQLSYPPQRIFIHCVNCKAVIFGDARNEGWIQGSDIVEPVSIKFINVNPGARFMLWPGTGELGKIGRSTMGNFGLIFTESKNESGEKLFEIFCNHHESGRKPDFKSLHLQITVQNL